MTAAPVCLCGCLESTKGGQFLPGHDARYKAHLIREALADNTDAYAELQRRNWLHFLEKTRSTRLRETASPSERRAARNRTEPEIRPIDLLDLMKAADRVLRQLPKNIRPELRPAAFYDVENKRAKPTAAYRDYLQDIINLSHETPRGTISQILDSETPTTQGDTPQ